MDFLPTFFGAEPSRLIKEDWTPNTTDIKPFLLPSHAQAQVCMARDAVAAVAIACPSFCHAQLSASRRGRVTLGG